MGLMKFGSMPARGYPLWAWVKPWNIVIGTSPKCGTRTLYEGLWAHFPGAAEKDDKKLEIRFADTSLVEALLPQDAARLPIPKIWIIRHPWERFKSLWRDKCRDEGEIGSARLQGRLSGLSPDDLFAFIRLPYNDNWHWTPQVRLMGLRGRQVAPPTLTLIRLEDFTNWWKYGELPTINTTEDKGDAVWSDELRTRVETLYKYDLELWELAE